LRGWQRETAKRGLDRQENVAFDRVIQTTLGGFALAELRPV